MELYNKLGSSQDWNKFLLVNRNCTAHESQGTGKRLSHNAMKGRKGTKAQREQTMKKKYQYFLFNYVK